MDHYFTWIQGWFAFLPAYDKLVREVNSGTIVEVGSFLGKSASYLGVEIINSKKDITLVCVDKFEPHPEISGDTPHFIVDTMYERFLLNMKPIMVELGDKFFVMKMDSVGASKHFADESLSAVWIDAGHSEQECTRDIRAWYPKVVHGGIIGGDDLDWPGVRLAVTKLLPNDTIRIASGWWHQKVKGYALPED